MLPLGTGVVLATAVSASAQGSTSRGEKEITRQLRDLEQRHAARLGGWAAGPSTPPPATRWVTAPYGDLLVQAGQ
ncbi:hypothetical protein GCM10018987_53940 [Streptomyces cremeus]